MKKQFLISLLCIFIVATSFSQTSLPALFSDSMVLQQQQPVAIWGSDLPGTKVIVSGSWGKEGTAVTDVKGHWKLFLQTPQAGGPYNIEIKGSSKRIIKNILIGEVWLCSGQSNMQMPVKGNMNQPVLGSNETILHSNNDQIRMVSAPRSPSITPLDDVKQKWIAASPATTGNFSAAAYFFAKKLQTILGVPIGIIHTSWGASTIESWMDKEALSGYKHIVIPEKLPETEANKAPTIMYNTMLHPYIGYTIKGALWYQGEANRENAHEYQSLFSTMIGSWRKQWLQGDFPFYFVQIAPFDYPKMNAAFLREAQLKTMQTVKNTGMVVTLDIGEKTVIHPSQKETVGNRLAYWALAKEYGVKGVTYSGPVYKSMQKNANDRILLTFDYSEMGLTSFGKALTNFEIAGEDKIFYLAEAIISNEKAGGVIVWNTQVKNPVSVRYSFKSWVEASLFNTQGLPASSFRTDDW